MKKIKLTTIIFAICCVSFLAFLAFNPSHAYFQSHAQATGVNTAKVDLLFDKFNEGTITADGTPVDLNADWGTPTNPYVMTGKNHVNNLFILQRSKYFATKTTTVETTDAEGNVTKTEVPRQSYFVVANKDGTPIVIDCGGMTINPIGSASNPFTGNIQGAPSGVPTDMTGISAEQQATYKYNGNSVSVSAIANLNVVAVENTPDIGFFGRLGYNGKVEDVTSTTEIENEDGSTTTITNTTRQLTGFAASLDNLLFADITISTEQAPGTDWWSKFTDNDKPHDECGETHHLGIIAGHAEWASITNISVYYSENVPAFDVGADTTNYYSIVGLLGTLSYVNPPAGSATGTVIAVGSISDEQLKEELLSGGGGEGSGMLKGYMLAKNIFDRKDADNTKTLLDGYAEAYDVKDMTEDDKPIFTEVKMPERSMPLFEDWVDHYYYYFADTVFTFAMSTERDETNSNAVDYLVKIWDIDETQNWEETEDTKKVPPPIYLTASADIDDNGFEDNWHYGIDENIVRYAYKLTAVTASSDLTEGEKYVLAYRDTDGTLYSLDIGNGAGGYIRSFTPYEEIITDDDDNVKQTFATEYFTAGNSSSGIKSMYVLSSTNANCQYAFVYESTDSNASSSDVTISNLDGSQWLGITSTGDGWAGMSSPILFVGTNPSGNGAGGMFGQGASSGYKYNWTITPSNNIVTIQISNARFGTLGQAVYNARFIFSISDKQFGIQQWDAESETPSLPANSTNELLLFKVSTSAEQIYQAQNVMPNLGAVEHTFNPSTDVLFYDKATNGYIATPLLQKQWNNGLGEYLTSLNHAVKMYQAAPENFQLTLSNTFIGDWFGDALDTNEGDVVLAPLGTTGINFTTPTGMIAYYINKASQDEPSMINIIVAVNPEKQASTIGLWGPQSINSATSNFDINNPYDSFPVPASISATDPNDQKTYMTKVSGYYTYDSVNSQYVLHNSGYATYLGGKIVLIGYTFTVTEPGVYLMGSTTGPMSVCYFSVDGAAGAGGDGTGGSPLGDVDFVYDNGTETVASTTILTVDQKFEGSHVVSGEDLNAHYYPSYYYIRMIPDADYKSSGESDPLDGKIPSEKLYIRRYIVDTPPPIKGIKSDRRRVIKLTATDPDTKLLGLSAIYQDVDYDTIDGNS